MSEASKTFRISAAARLFFDVEAETEEEALAKAGKLCDRLEDGVELDNVDSDDELVAGVVYPTENREVGGGYDLEVSDVMEQEAA